jgi:hypothetical protein
MGECYACFGKTRITWRHSLTPVGHPSTKPSSYRLYAAIDRTGYERTKGCWLKSGKSPHHPGGFTHKIARLETMTLGIRPAKPLLTPKRIESATAGRLCGK